MAKVKRKKNLQSAIDQTKRVYSPGIQRSMVDPMLGQVSTTMPAQVGGLSGVTTTDPQLGGLAGMNEGGMKNQIDIMEMGKQSQGAGAAPMMQPKKVKVKKKNKLMDWPEYKKMNTSANFQDYATYLETAEKSKK
jgi:hypothetical protein